MQIIIILEIFKDFSPCKIVLDANHHYPENIQRFFACKIVLAANNHYPENIQRLIRLQSCLRRKSSLSWKYSRTFSPAKLTQSQSILSLRSFKDFFACKFVLDPNHHYPESIQRLFRVQICLIHKSSLSWKYSKTFSPANSLNGKSSLSWNYSKTFSPAKLSSTQIIISLRLFKDFFACKNVLAANHHYPEKIQKLFRLQFFLRRKTTTTWKYSKNFSLAKLSSTQIIIILKIFKNFFACKIVLDANHLYPENIQRLIRLQSCLRRKSSLSWKYSRTFSPAKLTQSQSILSLRSFKDFFACKFVLHPNHHYPESIQRLFRVQICLIHKSSLSWKYSKTFSPANSLNGKSSLSWNYSKTFSPAKLSSTQIIISLRLFKDFFARKVVLAANHRYPEKIQKLFRLQFFLRRKTTTTWNNSKNFSLAKLSSTQIIIILKIFKDFFASKIVLAAYHLYPENIQRFFFLQKFLRCKSSLSWKYSKTFPPAKLS